MDRKVMMRRRASLAGVVLHHEHQNDRFRAFLDEQDRRDRERQAQRLASVDGRGEHRGQP